MTYTSRIDELHVCAWHAARRTVFLHQGEIAYYEKGQGEAALFVHGFPLNSLQWWTVTDLLAAERRCLVPDLLGFGHTRVTAGGVTFADQVEMLAAFLDTVKTGPVDLVANDSGSGVAQLFAARFPERVRTLVLTNGDVEPDSPPAPMAPVIALAKVGRFADEVLVPSFADPDFTRSGQGIGGLTYADPDNLSDAALEAFFAPLVESDERKGLVNAFAAAMDPNPLTGIEPRLRELAVPARILWGTGDGLFSADDPAYLDRLLPGSRGVREVPGGKVFWPQEQPDILAQECAALWQDAVPASAIAPSSPQRSPEAAA